MTRTCFRDGHNFLMAIYIEMNFSGLIVGYNSNLHGKFY